MAQSIPAKSSGAEIICHDPATGEEIGRARAAQTAWAARPYSERGRLIMEARNVILKELEEIAFLISMETGKPVAEAISLELTPVLDLMQHFARQTAKLLGPRRISVGQYWRMGRTSYEIYKPIRVIGIISPWNFPLATPLGEVVMALMAGNTVVLKPSELTPLTGLKIKEVLTRAGLPDGVLEVVTGDGSTGAALVGAGVDKIMFTGSVRTGRRF